MFEKFWETIMLYNVNTLFFLCGFLGIVYCFFKLDSANRKTMFTFITMLFILVYNPITYYFVYLIRQESTYYRLFWVFPMIPFLSVIFCDIIFLLKKNLEKIIFIGLVSFSFFITSENYYVDIKQETFGNIYGVSEDVIAVSEIIEKEGIASPVVLGDMPMQMTLRTYDSSVQMALARKEYMKPNLEQQHILIQVVCSGLQVDIEAFKMELTSKQVDFFVVKTMFQLDAYLQESSGVLVGRSTQYSVYRFDGGL